MIESPRYADEGNQADGCQWEKNWEPIWSAHKLSEENWRLVREVNPGIRLLEEDNIPQIAAAFEELDCNKPTSQYERYLVRVDDDLALYMTKDLR